MEQKTEASQAVDELLYEHARAVTQLHEYGHSHDRAANVKSAEDAIRAALKAQPAPTEAQGEPNKQVFENIEELRSAATAVVARWDSPKWKDEAPTADFIARLRKALQPSGNTGELVQGWDVDDLISNMGIEKEVAKARAELQADPAIIPSLLAVQGENSARLDAERYRWVRAADWSEIESIFWSNDVQSGSSPEACQAELDAAIDRARASAETGGVKS